MSSNVAAVRLSERVGRQNVIQAARDLGVRSPLNDNPSLALGTSGVTLLELTSAYAAVAAGAYPDVPAASEAMGKLQTALYTPIAENADRYDELFAEYTTLHDYFGRGHNDVMRRLKRIRREVAAGGAS